MHKIKVTRKGFSFDVFRPYSIVLNGEQRKLGYKNDSFFLTEKNEVSIKASIDWCSAEFQSKLKITRDEMIFNIRTNPIFSVSGLLGIIFITLFSIFDATILEILAVSFGVIYLLGITIFRRKYLQIEEVS